MKKIICLLLVAVTLTLCFAAVSCSEEPAPEGLQDVTAEGESYRLFVPVNGWEKLTGKGGSAAKCEDGSNVTLTRYMPYTVEESKPENYWNNYLKKEYGDIYSDFDIEEEHVDVTVGGLRGKKYVFTVTYGTVTHKQMQVLVQAPNADMYILTYTATQENYGKHVEDIEPILANFRFE